MSTLIFLDEVKMAIEELSWFVNLENLTILKSHFLVDKLQSFDLIFGFIDMNISEDSKIHSLLESIILPLKDIKNLLETDENLIFEIITEQRVISEDIKSELKHHEWRLVKNNLRELKVSKRNIISIEEKELNQLRKLFTKLSRETNKLIKIIPKKDKRQVKTYFEHILRFSRLYEHFLSNTIRKEKSKI